MVTSKHIHAGSTEEQVSVNRTSDLFFSSTTPPATLKPCNGNTTLLNNNTTLRNNTIPQYNNTTTFHYNNTIPQYNETSSVKNAHFTTAYSINNTFPMAMVGTGNDTSVSAYTTQWPDKGRRKVGKRGPFAGHTIPPVGQRGFNASVIRGKAWTLSRESMPGHNVTSQTTALPSVTLSSVSSDLFSTEAFKVSPDSNTTTTAPDVVVKE